MKQKEQIVNTANRQVRVLAENFRTVKRKSFNMIFRTATNRRRRKRFALFWEKTPQYENILKILQNNKLCTFKCLD